jgi:D-sedoheptulose 7-phosphate isomerase
MLPSRPIVTLPSIADLAQHPVWTQCLQRYPVLQACQDDFIQATLVLLRSFASGHKLLVCGNGGSCADADHICGELMKGFGQKRPLPAAWQAPLGPRLAGMLQGALPTIPLGNLHALNTAFANDVDPQAIFAQGVWGLGQANDVLLALSTSGNSANVLLAVQVARAKGLRTLGLTGSPGGQLRQAVDHCICAPATEVFKVQELHLPLYHSLCLILEDVLFPPAPSTGSLSTPASSPLSH